jgi:D-inositol-3-phosphate glycosyltransferase
MVFSRRIGAHVSSRLAVWVFDVSGRGGIAHHVFMMSNALVRAGADVTVVTTRTNEMDLDRAEFKTRPVLHAHYSIRPAAFKGVVYAFSLLRFAGLVWRERPKIVHWQELKLPVLEYLVVLAFQAAGIRVVCSVHDILNQERSVIHGRLRRMYHAFDHLIAHTPKNKDLIIGWFGVPSGRIDVIPVGEYSCIAGGTLPRREALDRLGVPPGGKVVLFFGYIRKYKGLQVLIRAFGFVRKQLPEAMLVVAGEPREDFAPYANLIRQEGLEGSAVTRLGYVPLSEIAVYFSAADLVVLPYLHIYQSGLLYLAFAYRKPVIVSRVGGLAEMVDDGVTGFLVPPGDPRRLADAILRAFADPEGLKRIGENGFRHAQTRYSWTAIAERTIRVYRHLSSSE